MKSWRALPVLPNALSMSTRPSDLLREPLGRETSKMAKRPLCVAFLWHMHQPDYRNVLTNEIYLPWTRFHAVKDYYDMGALVAQEPKLRLTINLVPVLMDQLRAYADGSAKETYADLTLRTAAELNPHEKSFLLRSFFQLPW